MAAGGDAAAAGAGPKGTPLRVRCRAQSQLLPSAVLAQVQVTRSSSSTRAHPGKPNSTQIRAAAPAKHRRGVAPMRRLADQLPMPTTTTAPAGQSDTEIGERLDHPAQGAGQLRMFDLEA